jgi:hypothetical protein
MKILIIGNSNSQYNINLCKYLKEYYKNNIQIDTLSLFHITNQEVYNYFDKVYAPNLKLLNNIPKIRYYYRRFKLVQLSKTITTNYDICNIQSFEHYTEVFNNFIRKKCKKLIISYWGSDINVASHKFLEKQYPLNDFAHCVTFCTEFLRDSYNNKLNKFSNKRKEIVELGSEPFGELISVKKTVKKKEAKSFLNLPLDKLILQIGYSGTITHQHLKILDKLELLTDEEKEKIFLILPMTYGSLPRYQKSVVNKLNAINIRFKVLTEFLNNRDLSVLRRSTDLFITLSTSDDCCSTLLEHLYLGNKIISGKWLPYSFIEDKWCGKICWVNDFEDFFNKIKHYIEDPAYIPNSGDLESRVKNVIYWPNNIIKWAELYESVCNNTINCKGSSEKRLFEKIIL